MSQTHNTVFISYRRSASAFLARAIYMDLTQHGYNVFMDVESIDSGTFERMIFRQIEARAHFLILCTPGTFERVTQQGDWLRREIEHAMDTGRHIVPILVNDFRFDDTTTKLLTGKLAELPRYNALNVPHEYFEAAMDRLRTRFLKLPVDVSLASVPAIDRQVVAAAQQEVEIQLAAAEKSLTTDQLVIRAGQKYVRNDYESAIADYTEALRLDPNQANAYYGRGFIHMQRESYDLALSDFQRYVELTSDSQDPIWREKAKAYIHNLRPNMERT